MNTKLWTVAPSASTAADSSIQEAAEYILAGKLVAFPTETVYGLGADARSTEAVERIFTAKGRPGDNPLIVHIANQSQLEGIVDTSNALVQRLMQYFWPGPLTIVLPVLPGAVSPAVTAGLDTLAIRMPDHPVALSLIQAADCLIAAPSSNRSGRPSPTRAEHVMEDLGGLIDGLIDGGPTGVGLESTVVEVVGEQVRILRPGGITLAQLREVAPFVIYNAAIQDTNVEIPRSPGMKYVHYAPKGHMTIVKGSSKEKVSQWIQKQIDSASLRGERTGILTYAEHIGLYKADVVISCGRIHHPEETAHALYHALRTFDQEDVSYILAEACEEEGLGLAVMNRLMKAAGDRVTQI
jgi:L-threonylcarbamoyladenylate synthase